MGKWEVVVVLTLAGGYWLPTREETEMVRDQGIGVMPAQIDCHSFPSNVLSCLGLPTLSASPLLKEPIGLSLGSPFSYHGLKTL